MMAPAAHDLKEVVFFKNLTEKEIDEALVLLRATEKQYKKDALILHAGSATAQMGLVLSGSVTIENNDVWGNRTILNIVGPNGFFAETYAYLKEKKLLVDVCANEDSRILFLHVGELSELAYSKKKWAIRLLSNLLTITAHKNLTLSERSFHTSPKTIRGRLQAYLNSISVQKETSVFDIPFDRQQLADYLNLDRTALSKELGKMQRDGLLRFHKNHFELAL